MKKLFTMVMAVAMAVAVSAQEDPVLMTINGKPIMLSEFMYIYEKNNPQSENQIKSMEDYLDLFVNFKLKVAEAESLGLDTTEAFKKELQGYRAQATPKYLQDKAAIDSLIRLTYYRMAHPRSAAHIAIQCPIGNDSADAAALAKIQEIRERVTIGKEQTIGKGKKAKTIRVPEDFLDVAKVESADPSAQDNGGMLGFITPLRYVYVFEDVVYNTPVGEVSEPFHTPFGWHIAKVMEEGEFEEIHAAHIMKMVRNGDEETIKAQKVVIDSIYQLLLAGADFEATAQAMSDDKGSAMRGGDLNYFSRGMMVKPFEDAVFSMQPGQVSKPFLSRFGWHIAKVYDHRGIQPLDSLYGQLEKNVQRDERMREADKSFVAKARKEYNLSSQMTANEVRQYADAHLEEKYPELRNLVREYHDGILLFDVSLDAVWDRAAKDTTGLKAYFKQHKKEYTWDEPRYKGYIIYAKDVASAKQARAIIRNSPDSINSYVNKYINNDSVKYVRIEHGIWTKGQDAVVDSLGFKLKNTNAKVDENMPIVMPVGKVIKAPEEYMDERQKVTSAYQDELEKAWVKELRQKYNVVVHREVLPQSLTTSND
ncbi:MAG: peptidylprolyl isomerase [Bacteroidales bacterium]|nr:peptidylprolyl isomerase [Candidatus Colicola coprequi]